MRLLDVGAEAARSAVAHKALSALTVVVVAGVTATVLLTTGRTVAAEDAVLAEVDRVGTRLVVVSDPTGEAGLTTDALDRVARTSGVTAVTGFGPAVDGTNPLVPGGTPVGVRRAYGSFPGLDLDRGRERPGPVGWAAGSSLERLGWPEGYGAVETPDGRTVPIVGRTDVPPYLSALGDVVLVAEPAPDRSAGQPLAVVAVLVAEPRLVDPVGDAVVAVLGVADRSRLQVETSEALARLRALIAGQLGGYGRGLVLIVLGGGLLLVSCVLAGSVALRRREFGRRRALGATRSLVAWLIVGEAAVLSIVGAGMGVAGSVAFLVVERTGAPPPGFAAGVVVLAVVASLLGSLGPATFAARRDPVRELRVP